MLYSKKKNENSFKNAGAFTDVQAAMNNLNANKKSKKFDNDRFDINKTNIECYSCYEKIILFVTVSNRNQRIRKETKVDRRNFDRVAQKINFIHYMVVMLTIIIEKNHCVYESW